MEKTCSAPVCLLPKSGLSLSPLILPLSQLQVTPAVKEGGGSNKVALLKATPLLFLHVQIFLSSDCLRLLPHEQHRKEIQYFTCQGYDKKYNSRRGWLTNSLAIYCSY